MTDQTPPPPEGSPPPGYGSYPPPGYGYPPPGYGPPTPQGYPQGYPPSALAPSDERMWAMFAHIGAILASVVAMAFLGPLIILLVQGSKSPFVRRHAVESLNFQITLLIALAVGVVLSVVTLGLGLIVVIPAALVIAVAALILIIMASVAANNGEDYRYPFTLRLVK
jgi:uncharacterized protein